MTRRYGASGILGLGVALIASTRLDSRSSVLAGVVGWFAVQAIASIAALIAGSVSSLAWGTVALDIALGALALYFVRPSARRGAMKSLARASTRDVASTAPPCRVHGGGRGRFAPTLGAWLNP